MQEKIITKGDEAYEMFILYYGEVGVYPDDMAERCVATLS